MVVVGRFSWLALTFVMVLKHNTNIYIHINIYISTPVGMCILIVDRNDYRLSLKAFQMIKPIESIESTGTFGN